MLDFCVYYHSNNISSSAGNEIHVNTLLKRGESKTIHMYIYIRSSFLSHNSHVMLSSVRIPLHVESVALIGTVSIKMQHAKY